MNMGVVVPHQMKMRVTILTDNNCPGGRHHQSDHNVDYPVDRG